MMYKMIDLCAAIGGIRIMIYYWRVSLARHLVEPGSGWALTIRQEVLCSLILPI